MSTNDDAFLASGSSENLEGVLRLAEVTISAIQKGTITRSGPIPSVVPTELSNEISGLLGQLLTDEGTTVQETLSTLTEALARGSADPADSACVGHLLCPPLAVGVAADLAVSALNQSLDSWDQGPAASLIERSVVEALNTMVGYKNNLADGVITSGGTESNLMGILLARDHSLKKSIGIDSFGTGLPNALSGRMKILCSRQAHFSIARNAGLLGLGENSVIPVDVDDGHRMDIAALEECIDDVRHRGDLPIAIVATAGTTDAGALDPLQEIAAIATREGVWFHVDAAYGGGALFSGRLSKLLSGVELADSVSLDLHKFGWLPVPAGAFLTRTTETLSTLEKRVAYLNPDDDEDSGYHSLLGRSIRTTRRCDAFKIAVLFRSLGKSKIGALVDRCHDLAIFASEEISRHPNLQLKMKPVLSTVLFRYVMPGGENNATSEVNAELRRELLREGLAVVGRTEIEDQVWLKLTLLNPFSSEKQIQSVIKNVLLAGARQSDRSRD